MTMKDLDEDVQFNSDFRDAVRSGFNHGLGFTEIADGWKLPANSRFQCTGGYSHVSRAPSFAGTNVRDLMRHPSAVFT